MTTALAWPPICDMRPGGVEFMYCRVLACDFDGTGATDGRLAPELAAAFSEARAKGFSTLLVTGRVHEDVQTLCTDLSMFDAVVAENGAVVCLPQRDRTIQLGAPPPAEFLSALRERGVPFQGGAVVLGTWERHAWDLFDLMRRHGIDGQIAFNRGAVMLLPTGVTKATGVRRALEELGRSEHNLVAFGDAENDLPLFALAELAVAGWPASSIGCCGTAAGWPRRRGSGSPSAPAPREQPSRCRRTGSTR
jgi:hydroxymethylpyrimidine pyrophosphatase-like HAD family hydrolase